MKTSHNRIKKGNSRIKRMFSVVLAMIMLMTCVPVQALANQTEVMTQTDVKSANTFMDVKQSDWFYDSVQYVYSKGIFFGTSETSFSPNEGMTRAMFVTALGRFAKIESNMYQGTGGFSDVDPDAYYAPYVAWASAKQITAGVGGGRFDIDGLVTREQMAQFASSFLMKQNIALSGEGAEKELPKDMQAVSDWAKESLQKLWNAGILNGDEKGFFNPKSKAQRAEAAVFFMNIDRIVNGGADPEPEASETPASAAQVSSRSSNRGGNSNGNGETGNIFYTVTFNSGVGPAVPSVQVQNGGKINSLPQPAQVGYIFVDWYTDSGYTEKFDPNTAITSNLTLYGRYIDLEGTLQKQVYDQNFQIPEVVEEEPVNTNFTVMVQADGYTADTVKEGLQLTATSGVDDRSITVTGSEPIFTVMMADGWTPGVSYKLEITDPNISFEKDETATAKLYYFTVDREENHVLALNDVTYVPSNAISGITVDGNEVGSISLGVYNFDATGAQNNAPLVGSFAYGGNDLVETGDILCIFDGNSPENALMGDTLYDNIAYIKVTNVNGSQIDFTNAEPEDVLAIPKSALIKEGNITNHNPTADGFSFNSITNEFESLVLGDDVPVIRPLEIGDTIAIYEGTDFLSLEDASEITMGRVTGITGAAPDFTITYETVTTAELEQSIDYHQTVPLKAKELMDLGYIDKEAIIEQLQNQAYDSGMINQLANQYALLALESDLLEGELASLEGLAVYMDDGSLANADQLRNIMEEGVQSRAVSAEKPKVNVKITTGGGKYGSNALVATLTITFEIKIENAKKDSIVINFEIKFTQEVYLGVGADAGISWHRIWGVPVWPNDVWISAYLDTKTYSGVDLKATANTKLAKPEKIKDPKTGKEVEVTEKKLDIASKINSLIDSRDQKEAYDEVSGIYKTYQDFMAEDWTYVELVRAPLMKVPVALAGGLVKIDIGADFVLSAALNVSLTCKISYQDGTRYSLNVSLAGPNVSFTQTQIVDKKFNFDVSFVGRFGLKAGIELYLKVGLVSTKLNSIGVMVQTGIYLEWMGFFSYQFEKNFTQGTSTSVAQGAMYAEVGIYLDANAEAQAGNGKYKVTIDLLSLQFPLLSTESKDYVYGFSINFADNEKLIVNRTKNAVPENLLKMIQLDLKGGKSYLQTYPQDKFKITFTDSAFTLSPDNKIIVNTTKDYLESDMIITWKGSPLAFTTMPISLKVPVVFTNSDNLTEKGLLTVKNQNDDVIWEERVEYGKNIAEYMPSKNEILNLLGYDKFNTILANNSTVNLKYADEGDYETTPAGIVNGDAAFVYNLPERDYSVLVSGIENPDGSTYTESFDAKYGQRFDFSLLEGTGTDKAGEAYTKFSKVQTKKGGQIDGLSIQDKLTTKVAVQLLNNSHTYHAEYDDDSATVTYEFITTFGPGLESQSETLRRGDILRFNYTEYVQDDGIYVIVPPIPNTNKKATVNETIKIYCKSALDYGLQFRLDGGKFVDGYTPPAYYLPTEVTMLPTRDDVKYEGKIFIDWFTDPQFLGDPVENPLGDNGLMTLYAMWRDPAYTIKFNANGGSGSMTEHMPATYGTGSTLPSNIFLAPEDEYVLSGGGFLNWNTKPDGSGETYNDMGTIKTPKVNRNGEVELYAQWEEAPKVEYQPTDTGSAVEGGRMTLGEALALSSQEPGTITLTESIILKKTIELPNNTVFDGGWQLNSSNITVRSEGTFPLFTVSEDNSAEIKNVRIYDPKGQTVLNSGTVHVEDVCVTGPTGIAFFNKTTGKMTIKYSAVMSSTVQAVANDGTIVLDNCSFSNSKFDRHDTAAIGNAGTVIINNTTILNNTNSGENFAIAAVHSYGGKVYLVNSTVAGNVGEPAIYSSLGGKTYIINSIVATNQTKSGEWVPLGNDWGSPDIYEIYNSIIPNAGKTANNSLTGYDENSGTIFSTQSKKVTTTGVGGARAGHMLTPDFNYKPGQLKTLSVPIYLDYTDLENIHLGYGNSWAITVLMGSPDEEHFVDMYIGGEARDKGDNRIGASYVGLAGAFSQAISDELIVPAQELEENPETELPTDSNEDNEGELLTESKEDNEGESPEALLPKKPDPIPEPKEEDAESDLDTETEIDL